MPKGIKRGQVSCSKFCLAAKDGHPGSLGVGWAWKPSRGDSAFVWRPLLVVRTSHVPSERDRAKDLPW